MQFFQSEIKVHVFQEKSVFVHGFFFLKHSATSTTPAPVTDEPRKYITEHHEGPTEHTTVIVSAVILSFLVMACFLVFVCQCRKKKAALVMNRNHNKAGNPMDDTSTTTNAASFKVLSQDKEVIALSPKIRLDEDSSTLADSSYMSSSNLDMSAVGGGHIPRHNNSNSDIGLPTFSMRYVTGSSTNVTDSNTALAFVNPPPTIASSNDVLDSSMVSLNDCNDSDDAGRVLDDDMSEMSDLTMRSYMPAPPATPLYCPSEVESCMTTDLELDMDSVSTRGDSQGEPPPPPPPQLCKHCMQQQHQYHQTQHQHNHQNPIYMNNHLVTRTNSNRQHACTCGEESRLGLSSAYTNSMDRRLVPPHGNSCSYCSSSRTAPLRTIDPQHHLHHQPLYATMGRSKPPSSYHPPSLVSEPSSYTSATLPKHLLRNAGLSTRPLLPSLASGISRCSSETSIITVRHKNDDMLPPPYCGPGTDMDSEGVGTSNYYNSYGPPPSPGAPPFPPDMNNFEDFKDEEEEARENDLLLESHRPSLGPAVD